MSWGAVAGAVVGGGIAAYGSKKAGEEAAEGQKEAASIIRKSAEEAKRSIFELVPISEANLQLGAQSALDIIGQTIPQQIGLARGGNIAAQQTLQSALPQMQNALLGRPTDMSAFQSPYRGEPIPDMNYKIPEFLSAVPETEAKKIAEAKQRESDIDDTIYAAYRELLNRDPDQAGLDYYRGQLGGDDGLMGPGNIRFLRKDIMGSEEYKRLNPDQFPKWAKKNIPDYQAPTPTNLLGGV